MPWSRLGGGVGLRTRVPVSRTRPEADLRARDAGARRGTVRIEVTKEGVSLLLGVGIAAVEARTKLGERGGPAGTQGRRLAWPWRRSLLPSWHCGPLVTVPAPVPAPIACVVVLVPIVVPVAIAVPVAVATVLAAVLVVFVPAAVVVAEVTFGIVFGIAVGAVATTTTVIIVVVVVMDFAGAARATRTANAIVSVVGATIRVTSAAVCVATVSGHAVSISAAHDHWAMADWTVDTAQPSLQQQLVIAACERPFRRVLGRGRPETGRLALAPPGHPTARATKRIPHRMAPLDLAAALAQVAIDGKAPPQLPQSEDAGGAAATRRVAFMSVP